VIDRISGRLVCRTCGTIYHVSQPPKVDRLCDKDGGDVVQREDDTPEAVKRRLDLYEKDTRPLLDFYDGLGLLVPVDGDGAPDDVFGRILDAVEEARQSRLSAPR
jgi:adenylate kinase